MLTVFNWLSPVPETLQRPDKLQRRGRSYLYNIPRFETKPLRDGCNTTVITSKRMKRFDCSLRHRSEWKVQHLQLSTTSKVRLLAWISRCGSLLAVDLSPYAIVASVLVHSGLERMTFYDGRGTHHVRNPSRPSPRFSYCKRQKLW